MFKELLNKENYIFEFNKLINKIKNNKKLLNKSYLNKEITLQWVIYNQDFIISELIKTIKNNNYKNPQAIELEINIKGKSRLIYAFDWHEKIFHNVVTNILNKHFEKHYSNSLKSYRKGFGVHSTLKELITFLLENDNNNFYLLKLDIKSYGDSIDHDELCKILHNYQIEEPLINLLKTIIEFNYFKNNQMFLKSKGLPTGSALNNVLCNIFLSDLDSYIFNNVNKSKYYRYGDDIIFLSTDFNEFDCFKNKIFTNIYNKKLLLNQEKIIQVHYEKDKLLLLSYLGFFIDFKTKEILLTKEKDLELKLFFKLIFKKIMLNLKNRNINKLSKLKFLILNYKNLILKSKYFSELISYFNVVNSESYWKQLDLYIATLIISTSFKIPKRKVFKKISYKTLRNNGLISLVHLRRMYLERKSNK